MDLNARYPAVSFSAARSTHRSNGEVQLGITVVLKQVMYLSTGTSTGTGTAGPNATNMVTQPQTVQGIPVQLPNGQIAYAIQQGQPMPIQMQQQPQHAQPVQVVVANASAPPPVYEPPSVNPHGNEGMSLVNNDGMGQTTGADHYQ